MRSVLRGLRHLGAFPGLGLWEYDDRDESAKGLRIAAAREARARAAWAKGSAGLDPALRGYLLGRQHDARIRGFRREGDRFTLTADDDDLIELAATVLGARWRDVTVPFDLVFEGVRYVGWRRVEDDGRLAFASEPKSSPETPVEWLDDALLDLGATEDSSPEALSGVRWGLLFQRNGGTRRDSGHHALLIEAERLRVVDRSREAWRTQFGEAALTTYDDYAPRRAELGLTNGGARATAYLEAATEAYRIASSD